VSGGAGWQPPTDPKSDPVRHTGGAEGNLDILMILFGLLVFAAVIGGVVAAVLS